MRSNTNIYEILIASPGDVPEERRILAEVIEDWNSAHAKATSCSLQARRWELDALPEMGGRPQGIINRQLVDDADLLFAVFSTRLGSPTGAAVSGTAEEIERLREMQKPVLVYFSQAPIPHNHNADELRRLNGYKERLKEEGLYFEYSDLEDLRRKASRHLATRMNYLMSKQEGDVLAVVKDQNQYARLRIRVGQKGRNGDVETINVIGEIQNLSPSMRIREYSCQLLVPSPLLKFASMTYAAEVKSDTVSARIFRHTEANFNGVQIHPGDTFQVVSVEVAIGHLEMSDLTGLNRQEAFDLCMNGTIVAEAVVDGNALRTEKPIREIFGLAGGRR
jgi:hypothetical protein